MKEIPINKQIKYFQIQTNIKIKKRTIHSLTNPINHSIKKNVITN